MSSSKPIVLALSNTIAPAIAVEILPLGATVHAIYLNADGITNDIVQGPADASQAAAGPYKFVNTIVGRYSNRIPVKEQGLPIEKNGYSATVMPIKNEGDKVSLHGGPNALDTVVFDKINPGDSLLFGPRELDALKKTEFSHSILTATMADGHNGFPGALRLEVLFVTINPSSPPAAPAQVELGAVLIVYRARLTEPGKITPINLTQHWGFNLENSLRGDDRNLIVREHFLTLESPGTLEIDDVMLPTGNLVANAGTAHEHVNKKIGTNYPSPGYDHYYLFSKEQYDQFIATQPPRPAVTKLAELDLLSELLSPLPTSKVPVELWSEKSNYKLSFSSNQGGVQFYTAIGQSGAGTRKPIHGGPDPASGGYPKEGAAYLEFHDPLAAFLHPQNGIDSLLTSDELYHNYVKLNISYKPTA